MIWLFILVLAVIVTVAIVLPSWGKQSRKEEQEKIIYVFFNNELKCYSSEEEIMNDFFPNEDEENFKRIERELFINQEIDRKY